MADIRTSFTANDFAIPYDHSMKIGRGFDLMQGRLSPAEAFTPESIKLDPATDVAAETTTARAPVEGVPVKVSAGYLGEMKVNDLQRYKILDCKFRAPPRFITGTPVLNDKAKAVLDRSPKEFLQLYGEYYIAGYSEESSFTAISKHTASTKESLDGYGAAVSAGLEGSPEDDEAAAKEKKTVKDEATPEETKELDAVEKAAAKTGKMSPIDIGVQFSAAMQKASKEYSVKTDIEVKATGVVGGFGAVSVKDMMKDFAKFLVAKNKHPLPTVAYIRHYQAIDSRAIRVTDELINSAPTHLTDAYKSIFKLQNRALSSKYPEGQAMVSDISSMLERLSRMNASPKAFSADFEEWKQQATALALNLEKSELRRVEIKKALKVWNEEPEFKKNAGDKGIPGGSPYVWKHGITETSKWHPKLAGELCCGESLCNKPYSMWSSIPDDIFEPSNGRIFVGFEVVDNWRDGTNGWFKVLTADKDQIKVHFENAVAHGISWKVIFYYVDKQLYPID